jgi:peptide/nickel transport system permease protein
MWQKVLNTPDFELSTTRIEQLERWKRLAARFRTNPLSIIGALMITSIVLMAIFAPVIAPYPEDTTGAVDFANQFEPPSSEHIMGTDQAGRDVFSRVVFGSRISLMIGVVVLSLAISVGTTIGLVAGYIGGKTHAVLMRTTDIFLSIPGILLAMAVAALLGPNLINAMLALAAYWWTWYARIVQGEVLSVKQEEYVMASRALGAPTHRIIRKEILPNVTTPIIVKATLDMGFAILAGAGLGFIGLGAQAPTPEWGVMVAQARGNILNAWWAGVFPGLFISYIVIGFNLLGDGLRDMFDVEAGEGGF